MIAYLLLLVNDFLSLVIRQVNGYNWTNPYIILVDCHKTEEIMPINIPDGLPAQAVLESENIFVINEHRATHQDIRPLRIVILNLMPKKLKQKHSFCGYWAIPRSRWILSSCSLLPHVSKNTPSEHLLKFYKTFDDSKDERFDGMIITGAPVEQMDFEEVDYWRNFARLWLG